MATLIRTNGTTEEVTPANRAFTGDELRRFVGRPLEFVAVADGRVMVLNEEGKLKGLPVNVKATELFDTPGRLFADVIVGDVLVATDSELFSEDEEDDDEDEYCGWDDRSHDVIAFGPDDAWPRYRDDDDEDTAPLELTK